MLLGNKKVVLSKLEKRYQYFKVVGKVFSSDLEFQKKEPFIGTARFRSNQSSGSGFQAPPPVFDQQLETLCNQHKNRSIKGDYFA